MKNNKIYRLVACFLILLSLAVIPFTITACDPNNDISRKVSTSFGGRSAYAFDNINGKTVTVETFFVHQNEAYVNNPNIGQAVMLNDAIRYKEAHPEEEVYASITSFHYSVVAGVCLDENSANYLKTKSLYDTNFDSDGYVRIAYLPIKAAMLGINVIVVGQIDASPVYINSTELKNDFSFESYYNEYLNTPANIEGKLVEDYLTFKVAKWTSYGDKSATDMMHLKSCTVSNYRDYNGNDHGCAIWLGSVNLDGIDYNGCNGNNNTQSATIVTEHDELTRVLYNYTKLLAEYSEQESVLEFRDIVTTRNKQQIDYILNNESHKIQKDEQIVYLGSNNDNVFELYFTPLTGAINEWNTTYNPYSKYFSKLLPENNGRNHITLSWAIAKFNEDSAFSRSLVDVMYRAFNENQSVNNKLFLFLPNPEPEEQIDYSIFNNLAPNINIGYKKIGVNYGVHTKDIQMSYVENGSRQYVSILNSLNFHQGSSAFQANSFLVIKENDTIGNNVYTDFGIFMSEGAITENDRVK